MGLPTAFFVWEASMASFGPLMSKTVLDSVCGGALFVLWFL
jgi:hypothetical protein